MSSQELGSSFEKITLDFFLFLFKQLNIQVNNNWIQKSGYQFGFDVGFEVAILNDDFFKRGIFIECKNYHKSKLAQSQLHEKLIQFDRSDYDKNNSIFIFLSPKIDLNKCTQDSNPKHLEDYFNQTKPFKTIILTPNNNVQDILSLNEEIFCKVYGETFTKPDLDTHNSILEYFHKLLFSKGEIPNFSSLKKRKEYLEQASSPKNKYYLNRKLKTNKFSFSFQDKSLLELIKTNDILLLLGEPGSGKTTELINISKYFEEKIIEKEITPIFISLPNINKFDTFQDVLPSDWSSSQKIVLLLDALDEFEFKSQLNKQITSLLTSTDISFKIVISCRTYAYGDELKSLNPAVFYLNDLSTQESFELLSKTYKIPLEKFDQISPIKFKDVLEDPFKLEMLGRYYKNHTELPVTPSEIFEDIKAELPPENFELYKILALVLELTKKTSADKKELKNLFGITYKKFTKLSFIESSFDNSSFKFIHKNYQEYFAATAISDLDFQQIINFISIEGVNKTHPTLFNTITFLINILSSDKYNLLIDWLSTHNPELLIKADKNRTENFRVKVFQEYFKTECIEKTFWISSATFSVKEIAEFGDCEENFHYLVSIINNKESHFRVIISALELLSYFSIPIASKENLKTAFFNFLKDSQISEMIKSHIIDCIVDQKLCDQDEQYLRNIFDLFKSETNKQVNRALLSLIHYYPQIDSFFWYIKDEFLRENGYIERIVKDEVLRGTSWILEELILRFENHAHFIALIEHYFDETKDNYTSNEFIEKIIKRCLYFEDVRKGFITDLLSYFFENANFSINDDALRVLLLRLTPESQLEGFKYLADNIHFDRIGYFLASIADEQNINLAIEKFANGSFESTNLDLYRNVIANHGRRKLAEHFNNTMLEKGFVFREVLLSEEEYETRVTKFKNLPQDNFDILFNQNKLHSKINTVFADYGASIDSGLIRKIQTDWFRKNDGGNKLDISISILRRLIHIHDKAVQFTDITHMLKDDFIIINEIKSQIHSSNDTHNKFNISSSQKAYLNSWCQKASNEIRFDRIIKYVSSDRYGGLEDYGKLKTILFIVTRFDFNLSQDFLLNCIEFIDVNNSDEEVKRLEWLKLKINNDPLFNQRIIDNLNTKNLVFLPLNIHIQYALDNNLSDAFQKIREHFLMPDYNYNIDKKLEQYISLTGDYELLKNLCSVVTSHKYWSAVQLLMKLKIEQDFCEQKAVEYLEENIEDEKNYYSSSALSVLFELNSLAALNYVSEFLSKNKLPSLNQVSYSNYDAIDNYEILGNLLAKLNKRETEKLGFDGLENFIVTYVTNLSKNKESYNSTQDELALLKSMAIVQNSDNELYLINHLIDKSQNGYINSQSKAMNFKEALQKVEEIIK